VKLKNLCSLFIVITAALAPLGCQSANTMTHERVQLSVLRGADALGPIHLGAGDALGEAVFAEQWAGIWSPDQGPHHAQALPHNATPTVAVVSD